ncbi:acetyl-CoA carboxylase biotin carboxylase subunit family protein [Mesorhizobium sp. M0030]|uniref:ATP-grasp domain-containing protein n=1 Tax=Mesorhizobium sp. M0030 TaxID=2956851 RepID=UPI00333D42C3
MARKKAFLMLEGNNSNGQPFVKVSRRLGLHPIVLSIDPAQYDYIAAESTDAIRVDTNNLDALIRECSRLRATCDIAGITSAKEAFYATAGKLCRHFALPGPNPTSIERCCDKFTQRQLLAEAGVPIPAYRLATNAADIEISAAEIGLPVVLKPTVGVGSSGVRLCRSVDELTKHTTYLLGGGHIWQSSPRVLVEAFAEGQHYIVHIMGNEVFGIEAADFDRPPNFVFRKGIFPAPLTDDEHKRIADVSLSCLRALGLGWGPTCIELRWTRLGPVVIEVNPRLGGGPQHIQLACGVDLIAEHIKLVIGDGCNLRKTHSQFAAWQNLLPDRDGTLEWINGDNLAATISGVAEVTLYVEPNTPIVRKGDRRDFLGYVIAVSPSRAQAEEILQRAIDLIGWSIVPFPIEQEQSPASHTSAPVQVPAGKG